VPWLLWLLFASGGTCNGLSTGEPFREVRVYVDGQLAGFSPIYYTMFTVRSSHINSNDVQPAAELLQLTRAHPGGGLHASPGVPPPADQATC
jgi:hypothetical protein